MKRNADGTPTQYSIRNDGAIPFASQIQNDSDYPGDNVAASLNVVNATVGARRIVKIEDLAIPTLNNEKSKAVGGSATEQLCPVAAMVHLKAVGTGTAASGDVEISIGTSAGGTQIKTAGAATGLTGLNGKFVFDLTGGLKAAIAGNATFYAKVTTADTTAGAGHLADVYVICEVIGS